MFKIEFKFIDNEVHVNYVTKSNITKLHVFSVSSNFKTADVIKTILDQININNIK